MAIAPDMHGWPRHCHGAEEELFVILAGSGTAPHRRRRGARASGARALATRGDGLAHSFRAGPEGLEYLAYGQREPNDVLFYPDSGKLSLAGVGVIVRVQQVEYWDGEDDPA